MLLKYAKKDELGKATMVTKQHPFPNLPDSRRRKVNNHRAIPYLRSIVRPPPYKNRVIQFIRSSGRIPIDYLYHVVKRLSRRAAAISQAPWANSPPIRIDDI